MPVLVDNGWIGEYDFEQEHGRIFYAWVLGWRVFQSHLTSFVELQKLYHSLEEGLLSYELIALHAPPHILVNFSGPHARLALEGMLFRAAATLASVAPSYRDKYMKSPWGKALRDPDYLEEILLGTGCNEPEMIKARLGLL